jgi:hypothetical protein
MKLSMAGGGENLGMTQDELRNPDLINTMCGVRPGTGAGQAKDGIDFKFVSENKRKDKPPREQGSVLSIITIDACSTHAVYY